MESYIINVVCLILSLLIVKDVLSSQKQYLLWDMSKIS